MVLLNSYFLWFLSHLSGKNCECSHSWRRKFLEYSLALFISLVILSLVGITAEGMGGILGAVLSLILLGVDLAYIIITRQYIDELSNTRCTCATHKTAYEALNLWNILQILLLVFCVVSCIFVVLFSRPVGRSSSSRR